MLTEHEKADIERWWKSDKTWHQKFYMLIGAAAFARDDIKVELMDLAELAFYRGLTEEDWSMKK